MVQSVQDITENLQREKAATTIQSYFRMQRALKKYKILSDQREVEIINYYCTYFKSIQDIRELENQAGDGPPQIQSVSDEEKKAEGDECNP